MLLGAGIGENNLQFLWTSGDILENRHAIIPISCAFTALLKFFAFLVSQEIFYSSKQSAYVSETVKGTSGCKPCQKNGTQLPLLHPVVTRKFSLYDSCVIYSEHCVSRHYFRGLVLFSG